MALVLLVFIPTGLVILMLKLLGPKNSKSDSGRKVPYRMRIIDISIVVLLLIMYLVMFTVSHGTLMVWPIAALIVILVVARIILSVLNKAR